MLPPALSYQRSLVVLLGIGCCLSAASTRGEEADVQYAKDIQPILTQKCLSCHGPDAASRQADLRLDLETSAKASRDEAPAIVAGKPLESGLMQRIVSDDEDLRMPPVDSGLRLSRAEIELFRRWIEAGAEFESHWAFEPVVRPTPPQVANASWPAGDIDRFVLARLEAHGLQPAQDADRATLIRRLTFDLTGMPPTIAEVDAFVSDRSDDAYEKVVDRLLASQHFGERWARHWLDLVRYAETYGYEHDWPIPLAWRYRDYAIRMFNADVPYDQIIREHLAGDLLDNPRRHPIENYNESIIGTGYWYLHGQMSQPVDVRQHEADRFDNQIDVFSRAFLGLTVACARCHDHKFDPVSTEDYYGLIGFLRSSRRQETYLDSHGEIAESIEELSAIRRQADAAIGESAAAAVADEPAAAADTVMFENFSAPDYRDWSIHGEAFGIAPTQAGQWDRTSATAVAIRPGLAHSGMLAGRLQGTLQSPEFELTHPHIWLRVAGRGKVRLIINGYMMQRYKDQLFGGTEIQINVPAGEFRWVELAGELKLYRGHPAYLEIVDNSDDYLVIDEIRFADRPPPAPSTQTPGTPATPIKTSQGDVARFADWAQQMKRIDEALPLPKRAMAICDGRAADVRVKIRGEIQNLGPQVPRRLPNVLQPQNSTAFRSSEGSGRLRIARQMLNDSNPLVARVRVNWIWHHLFGRGIVASVDNFGTAGERPSHPELLDYLADRFRTASSTVSEAAPGYGWSIKQLIREVVLSRTYRMSSRAVDKRAERVDPTNALLHRMRIRRLQGEAIRDAMLTVAGELDASQFGPAVPVHLTPFMQGLSRPEKSGPLDGNRRRSIYLEVRRNFLSPMFVTFDAPLPSTCVAKRNTTNVPAQALILMNDPFVAQQATAWAARIMQETFDPEERIDRFYRAAFSRPPKAEEIARAKRFLNDQAEAYQLTTEAVVDHRPLWADLAHALFGVKEFIFVR